MRLQPVLLSKQGCLSHWIFFTPQLRSNIAWVIPPCAADICNSKTSSLCSEREEEHYQETQSHGFQHKVC